MFKKEHPTRTELFEHAENLTAKQVSIASDVARHLVDCESCKREVHAMRDSLAMLDEMDTLSPTRTIQASVLLAAKPVRGMSRKARFYTAKTTSLTACALLLMATFFQTTPTVAPSLSVISAPQTNFSTVSARISIEGLSQPTPEEEVLGAALARQAWSPSNRWEKTQWRAITELDDDIEEALKALQNNPALVRASTMVSLNRERKKETLKTLYVERNL